MSYLIRLYGGNTCLRMEIMEELLLLCHTDVTQGHLSKSAWNCFDFARMSSAATKCLDLAFVVLIQSSIS